MSQDKKSYEFTAAYCSGRYRAASYCLRGLFDRVVSADDRLNRLTMLSSTWQKRLRVLQAAGWSFLQDAVFAEAPQTVAYAVVPPIYEPYGLMRNKHKEVVEIKKALEEDVELEQEDFLHV